MAQHGKTQLQPAQCPLRHPQRQSVTILGEPTPEEPSQSSWLNNRWYTKFAAREPMTQGCSGDSPPHSPSEGQARPVQPAVRPPSQLAAARSAKRSGPDLGTTGLAM